MSQDAIESFLGRIITDREFRLRAAGSIEGACRSAGLVISDQEGDCLRSLDLDLFSLLAESVDDEICRS